MKTREILEISIIQNTLDLEVIRTRLDFCTSFPADHLGRKIKLVSKQRTAGKGPD